jgi:hypothetical protein
MVYRVAQAYCAATGFADKRPPVGVADKAKIPA